MEERKRLWEVKPGELRRARFLSQPTPSCPLWLSWAAETKCHQLEAYSRRLALRALEGRGQRGVSVGHDGSGENPILAPPASGGPGVLGLWLLHCRPCLRVPWPLPTPPLPVATLVCVRISVFSQGLWLLP